MSSLERNNKSKSWFNRPYFYNDSISYKLYASFGLSIFSGLFIWFFRPFNINHVTQNFEEYAFICAVIILVDLLIYFFILNKLFPKFFDAKKWTVGKHLISVVVLLLQGAVITWIFNYRFYDDTNVSSQTFLSFLRFTLGIGIFPILIFLFIDERYGNYRRKKVSRKIRELKNDKKALINDNDIDEIVLYATNEKDSIKISRNDLLYITSNSNYINVFIKKKGGGITEKILRKQLTITENDLSHFKEFVRCHKSYIVNTNYVTDLTGNARGYYLHLDNIDVEIPVSRKFKKDDLIKFVQ